MGRPVEKLENRTEIKQLKNHHRSMARDIIAMGGIRTKDLARIYNMYDSQISIIINSPVFVAELARLEDMVEESICDVREDIRLLAPRAKRIITEELYKEDDAKDVDGTPKPMPLAERKLRLSTAFDILDRDSGKKKHGESAAREVHFHTHQELHVTKNMSTEDLQRDVFDLLTDEDDA